MTGCMSGSRPARRVRVDSEGLHTALQRVADRKERLSWPMIWTTYRAGVRSPAQF